MNQLSQVSIINCRFHFVKFSKCSFKDVNFSGTKFVNLGRSKFGISQEIREDVSFIFNERWRFSERSEHCSTQFESTDKMDLVMRDPGALALLCSWFNIEILLSSLGRMLHWQNEHMAFRQIRE